MPQAPWQKKKTQKGHLDPREDNSSSPISYPGFGILIGSRKESLWQESDQQGRALLKGDHTQSPEWVDEGFSFKMNQLGRLSWVDREGWEGLRLKQDPEIRRDLIELHLA